MLNKQQIPNFLTCSRVAAILLIVPLLFLPWGFAEAAAVGLFLYAAITDYFDGKLARRWQVESDFGRMLDPIADKLLVVAVLLPLLAQGRADLIPVLAILLREIFVSGLREQMIAMRIPMPVSVLAKYKTASQMAALLLLLLAPLMPWPVACFWLGRLALWAAAGLTLLTGWDYLRNALAEVATRQDSPPL